MIGGDLLKVAFLDRDGTIVKDYPDEKWRDIVEPEFLDGSIEGLKALHDKGYELIVVTNQYIINDGYITFKQYESFTQKMVKSLEFNGINLLDIFYCEHSEKENCDCKKPKIGMFEKAVEKYEDIEVSSSLMFGDSECDKVFASNAGLKFYGIKGGSLANQEACYKSIDDMAKHL